MRRLYQETLQSPLQNLRNNRQLIFSFLLLSYFFPGSLFAQINPNIRNAYVGLSTYRMITHRNNRTCTILDDPSTIHYLIIAPNTFPYLYRTTRTSLNKVKKD